MSREKKLPSWRDGKQCWRVRIYLNPDVIKTLRRQAARDERDEAYFISKAIEKFVEQMSTEKESV